MPAVVRVKRRIDEEPLGAFVLNGKKRRIDEAGLVNCDGASANKDEISTVLKFAGTVHSQDDSATTQFARLTKDQAKQLVQKSRKPTNVTERTRQEMRHNIHENRFKVVNCFRTAIEDGELQTTKEVTIVDIEKQQQHQTTTHAASPSAHSSSNSGTIASAATASTSAVHQQFVANQPTDSDTGYVYDLYLPENEQQAEYVDLMDDNHLSVRAFDDLVYEDRFNNEDDEYDSEDSNNENHLGNDYPDEDDETNSDNDSIGEREMCRAVQRCQLDDDDEDMDEALSSDDEDNVYTNDYAYSIDADEDGFADDIDYCDVNRYGIAYARYKANVLKKMKAGSSDDDGNDEDSDKVEVRYHGSSDEDDDEKEEADAYYCESD